MTTVDLKSVTTEGDLYVADRWIDINDSEVIEGVGYNKAAGQLFVQIDEVVYVYNFNRGAAHEENVEEFFYNFLHANSMGRFYANTVKPFHGPSVDVVDLDSIIENPDAKPVMTDVSASESVVTDFPVMTAYSLGHEEAPQKVLWEVTYTTSVLVPAATAGEAFDLGMIRSGVSAPEIVSVKAYEQ